MQSDRLQDRHWRLRASPKIVCATLQTLRVTGDEEVASSLCGLRGTYWGGASTLRATSTSRRWLPECAEAGGGGLITLQLGVPRNSRGTSNAKGPAYEAPEQGGTRRDQDPTGAGRRPQVAESDQRRTREGTRGGGDVRTPEITDSVVQRAEHEHARLRSVPLALGMPSFTIGGVRTTGARRLWLRHTSFPKWPPRQPADPHQAERAPGSHPIHGVNGQKPQGPKDDCMIVLSSQQNGDVPQRKLVLVGTRTAWGLRRTGGSSPGKSLCILSPLPAPAEPCAADGSS